MDYSEKNDRSALEAELLALGAKIERGGAVLCPLHDDKSPSGSIYRRKSDNTWAYHCHGCYFDGDVFDLREVRIGEKQFGSGMDSAAVHPPQGGGDSIPPPPPIEDEKTFTLECLIQKYELNKNTVKSYNYGSLLVLRIEGEGKKQFKQFHAVEDQWAYGAPEKPWPLYNLNAISKADAVIVVEGEKAADALIDIGLNATTSPAGAGKAPYADWSALSGKTVVLWPDKDEKGIDHMQDVKSALHMLKQPVTCLHWIDPPDELPKKGDAFDYLEGVFEVDPEREAEAKRVKVRQLLAKSRIVDGTETLTGRVLDTISGKRRTIDWPFPMMAALAKPLWPGTVTIICGGPGSGKSFFLLQALWYWINTVEIKACIFELEEDVDYHLYRALVQFTGQASILDDAWVRANGETVERLLAEHKSKLSRLRKCIFDSKSFDESLAALSNWAEDRAKEGNRVICIDPISVASKSEKPWEDDRRFVREIARISTQYQCSIVLVSHPRPGSRKNTIDDMAGGASYQRLSQTILWLEQNKKRASVEMYNERRDKYESIISHELKLSKTRNGKGRGLVIGLDCKGLKFEEKGVLV